MPNFRLLAAAAACALAACSAGSTPPLAPRAAARIPSRASVPVFNDIPPRLQWEHNYGYCGEVSMISAGLYYGQYASQYTARALASNETPQNRERSQLLVGVNAAHAAARMHLAATVWNTANERNTDAFLAWVKKNVLLDRPVIIGVYNNEYRLYHNTNPHSGDSEYDHVVPVVGVTSVGPGYNPRDTITFSDNGLWGPPTPYLFTYRFASFQRDRVQANAKNGPLYSLANDGRNYGIAITGVLDRDRETVPVRVATSVNYEKPAIGKQSNVRPKPMPLVLTVTVWNLRPGTAYVLYRYDRFSSVPDGRFNAGAARASQRWAFRAGPSGQYVVTQRIMSDDVAVYRAVPATAP
jgi:hypothetical protein